MTDLYAVMGNPIAHSKSPQIHQLFAAQTQQDLDYRAILVEQGSFAQAVDDFRLAGGLGLNITVPFKSDAHRYAVSLSPRAERAGAVNTLHFSTNAVFGDNTDGPGLVRDLTVNHDYDLTGKRILLLGAGGAARGVLQPLLVEKPDLLVIANRTPTKAIELATEFVDLGEVRGCGFADLANECFNLIINATAAGLSDAVPSIPEDCLAADAWCYDMMYSDQATAFVQWARAAGAAKALDGLGMLVEQAAESFLLWRGTRPDTQAVIDKIRPA